MVEGVPDLGVRGWKHNRMLTKTLACQGVSNPSHRTSYSSTEVRYAREYVVMISTSYTCRAKLLNVTVAQPVGVSSAGQIHVPKGGGNVDGAQILIR